MTAGEQKILSPDPLLGFLAQAHNLREKQPALEQALAAARSGGSTGAVNLAEKELRSNRVLRFNNLLDAFVTAVFLVLVGTIAVLSVREWILLLGRRKLAQLRETEPVWLPEYAISETRPLKVMGVVALAISLAREWSGEAHLERALHDSQFCGNCHNQNEASAADGLGKNKPRLYLEVTERRFNGVTRCC
jgi:carbon starvation protein